MGRDKKPDKNTASAKDIARLDHDFVWHPFTQMKDWANEEPIIIVEGRDCFIRDMRGRWYLDGVSSLWVNTHGHRRAEIDEAIIAQLGRIAHTTMLGLANEPATVLAARLAGLIEACLGQYAGGPNPRAPRKTFYSDNGSTAVEVAIKMALQYWQHKGHPERTGFIALKNAYHGDTIGAMSVGGVDIFHSAFSPLLFGTDKAPSPHCHGCELGSSHAECAGRGRLACLGALEDILKAKAANTAAMIIEPLVQAAGGMHMSPPGYLRGVRELCTRYGVPLIADEIATGFGRTGRMFACEHEGVVPDIICLSKGITGGYMPLAVTVATDEIYDAFLGEFIELKTFFHGHSYTGNPLGCAAALACLDIFDNDRTLEALGPKISLFADRLAQISSHPHVSDARNRGLIGAVDLVRDKPAGKTYEWAEKMGWRVAYAMRERGVIIRPLGNTVVLMPPLAISIDNLAAMMDIMRWAVDKATRQDA